METKEKMKPGEFKFNPYGDWIVIRQLHIESAEELRAKKANIQIAGAPPPKNIMELERLKMKQHLTYDEYQKVATEVYDGKHGWQGIVKAIGPQVPENFGINVGDKIYYRGGTGEPIVHNKSLYWMLKPHEIFGRAPKYEHDIK